MSLHWCQPHHSFIDEFLTLSPSLSLSCYFIFSIVSTITLSVVPGRKRFARGTPLGCVWLEEWKSGRIENGGRIEKILISLLFVWLEVKKWRNGKSEFV